MLINDLGIHAFRNLSSVKIEPCSGFNQFVGANGAGKSSILEAIYLLSAGHSFRTRKTKELIGFNEELLSVTVKLENPLKSQTHQAGISKSRSGDTVVKLDYEQLSSIADMSRLLPVKALYPDSHRLVQEGPEFRRQFMDWGVFHVEQEFFMHWKHYRRALQQRNQALRIHRSNEEVAAWDDELALQGNYLHSFRDSYVKQLKPVVADCLKQFGLQQPVDIRYRTGWAADTDLLEALVAEQTHHPRSTFTTVGPHRAELALLVNGHPARQVLSRGEQKMLVYALHFSQLKLFCEQNENKPIVLCDDLAAELDDQHRELMLNTLSELSVQVFISGNRELEIPVNSPKKVFHVEHGTIPAVL